MLMVFVHELKKETKCPNEHQFPLLYYYTDQKALQKELFFKSSKIYVHMISIRCKNGYFKINDSNQTLFEDIY